LPRKKGHRPVGINSGSPNSISIKHSSSTYTQNVAYAPLVLAEFDNATYITPTAIDYELWLGRLAEEFVHQVGNPLCALKGFVALAAEAGSDLAAYHPLIQVELEQIEKALKLFSIIAGNHYETVTKIDLRELITDIIGQFTPLAIKRGVWVTLPHPPSPIHVQANPEKLELALTQILNNALEASQPGEVIDLRLHKMLAQAWISVTNSSTQPLPAGWGDTFQPFFTTKPEHLGLGLWLADRIARSYKGRINIESRDLLVTTTISLPLVH